MKPWNTVYLSILLTFLVNLTLAVASDHANTAGPKGGRLLAGETPRPEFFVNADRKIEITFYDENLKPVLPSDQGVSVVAEAKSGKASLSFEPMGDAFVSTAPLPEGDGYLVVVQIRSGPDAKPRNYRIQYHDDVCETCKRAEYACVCAGEAGNDHGHEH